MGSFANVPARAVGRLRAIPIGTVALFAWLFYYQWAPALVPSLIVPAHHAMIPGFSIDARFNLAMLENGYLWLAGKGDLFSPGFYFPLADVGGLSDLHLGTLPAYAIWRFVGADPFTSAQAWTVLAVVANFVSAYVVARRFGLAQLGASIAAATFTFAPPASDRANWWQDTWRAAVPPATYWVTMAASAMRSRRRPDIRITLMVIGWLSFAFLCAPYTGVLTFFWAICLLLAILSRSSNLGHWSLAQVQPSLPTLAAVSAVSVAAVVVGLRYMRAGAEYAIGYSFGAAGATPGPMGWLTSTTAMLWNPISTTLNNHSNPPDAIMMKGAMFLGLGVMVASGYAIWRSDRRPWTLPIGLAIAVAAFSITASSHVSVFVLLSQLPGFGIVRGPSRLVLELLFPIGLLAGAGLTHIQAVFSRRVSNVLLALFVAELTFVYVPGLTKVQVYSGPEAIAAKATPFLATAIHPVLLVLPEPSGDPWDRQMDAMLAAQILQIPTMNGRTSSPLLEIPPTLTCGNLQAWLANLPGRIAPRWPRLPAREVTVIAVGDGEGCAARGTP